MCSKPNPYNPSYVCHVPPPPASRHNRDARVYCHTTTAMHTLSNPPPPPPSSSYYRFAGKVQELHSCKAALLQQEGETERWKGEAEKLRERDREARRALESGRVASADAALRSEVYHYILRHSHFTRRGLSELLLPPRLTPSWVPGRVDILTHP